MVGKKILETLKEKSNKWNQGSCDKGKDGTSDGKYSESGRP